MTLNNTKQMTSALFLMLLLSLLLAGCVRGDDAGNPEESDPMEVDDARASNGELYSDLEMVTLLPRDAIQAIDDPKFDPVKVANESYDDEEMILGVAFNGEARAYSIPMLSSHEIVNDTIGGVKIAVTW